MDFEKCDECGFIGEKWSDAKATSAIADLPARFADAVAGLNPNELLRRPIENHWSIAEYTDHVREVVFGMRVLLEMVVSQPGIDLGDSHASPFEPQPRKIDVDVALLGLEREATSFLDSLTKLTPNQWDTSVTLDRTDVDPHWIIRHTVHDSNHHLLDIKRLRLAL
jgi:S-DNA-T family DNA segregation ATPase FtsK/SpoIIIE